MLHQLTYGGPENSRLSGATEWDYLSDWKKQQWLRNIPLIFISFGALVPCGTVAYFAVMHRSLVMIVLSLAGTPIALSFLLLFILMSGCSDLNSAELILMH